MKTKVLGVLAVLFVAVLLGCTSTGKTDESMSSDAMAGDAMAGDDDMAMQDDSMSSDSMSDDSMSEDTMADDMLTTEFTVTVAVLSGSSTPIAPLAWAVHTGPNPFVTGDMGARLHGLEALAEDGDPADAAHAVSMVQGVTEHGVVATPDGAMDPGPAAPGSEYTFTINASEGEKLSFATMYVQSNDLFYSTPKDGLSLFDMGHAVSGDVTDRIVLYDAGTEVNEEPGMGPNQAPRQSGPNTGPDEMGMVMTAASADQMYMYPHTDTVLRVTVEPHDDMM